VSLARAAVAGPLGELASAMRTTPEAAAEGILAVVDTAMEGALRVISVERGHDPADFTLVAFGGAAGLHAVSLAQRLGVARVLIPPSPGVLSAFGMLVAPVTRAASRSVLRAGRTVAELDMEAELGVLEREAAAGLIEELGVGDVDIVRTVAARYCGQSYELTLPCPAGEDWVEAFHTAHRRRYGHASPGAEVEAVTLRVEAMAPGTPIGATSLDPAPGDAQPASQGLVVAGGSSHEAVRYARDALRPGHHLSGPCIVMEYSATTWIPPGWTAGIDGVGSLILEAGS